MSSKQQLSANLRRNTNCMYLYKTRASQIPILNANGGCATMHPSYPAVSPYVTAVGGTELGPDPTAPLPSQASCRTFGTGAACVVREWMRRVINCAKEDIVTRSNKLAPL